MRNGVQRPLDDVVQKNGRTSGVGAGNGFFSARSLSNYMRIVSSGASNVASSVRSAGASIVSSIADRHDDANHRDQVLWAGFDKLESENDACRQVLLLGYRSGFEVWDVEQADNVKQLASRRDGRVSFLQMQKKLIASKRSEDKFADARPMLVVVGDGSGATNGSYTDGFASPCNGFVGGCQDLGSDNFLPTFVRFYSLRIHDFVHVLKFRSAIFSIRCSPRVVAISQASQIHCFDAATLEREYTILTYPVILTSPDSGSIGYGPLAVGVRWLAYSGNLVEAPSTTHVSPQDVNHAHSIPVPPNGSMMAYYAKESSKQLAAGLVTLGDLGYKKLSKYYSDFLADNHGSMKYVNSNFKANGTIRTQPSDIENVGMVIVRDIVSKSVIVQFQAHANPISALCFDPSGTLLVTASIHGHNINVFKILPSPDGTSGGSHSKGLCVHLYRLQRGITNAVIQDISFSDDSSWIMVSSSRGTCHLFSTCSSTGNSDTNFTEGNFANSYRRDLASKTSIYLSHNSCSSKFLHQNNFAFPITLSAVSRIRNGSTSLKGVVNGAAAAATGKVSPLHVAIASTFHNCKGPDLTSDISSLNKRYYLLVFSPSGSIIQYVLHQLSGEDSGTDIPALGANPLGLTQEADGRVVIEALQKWDICHKRSRRDGADNVDIYGDHASGEGSTKGLKKGTSINYAETGKGKVKYSTEEIQQSYISEVELHTHDASMPLWMKSGISFQVMIDGNGVAFNSMFCSGEIEIERNPTRTIEARSKDLIPIFNYLQIPKFQQQRKNDSHILTTDPLMHKTLGSSEDEGLSLRNSSNSLDMPENAVIAGFQYQISDKSLCQPTQQANKGFVNNCIDSPHLRCQLEDVNSSRGSKMTAQRNFVNITHNQKLENYFEDNDNDID